MRYLCSQVALTGNPTWGEAIARDLMSPMIFLCSQVSVDDSETGRNESQAAYQLKEEEVVSGKDMHRRNRLESG